MSDLSTLLSSALLDRGLLIETIGQDIYLTDNAFLRDDHGGSRRRPPACHYAWKQVISDWRLGKSLSCLAHGMCSGSPVVI